MEDTINIAGLDKVEVFRRLYNAARPQGMGFLHATGEDMEYTEAKLTFYASNGHFDYHKGRVMKVDFSHAAEHLWVGAYNRDNGHQAAQRALADLLSTQET